MKISFIFRLLLLAGTIVATGSQIANAQFLKKLANHVKEAAQEGVDQAATNHAVNDAGNATDKMISKAEKAAGKAAKGNNNQTQDNNTSQATGPDAAAGSDGSTSTGSSATAAPSIKSYQNYDFVPGDTILFADDFTEDQNGEFPSHWDLGKGQAVVNQVTGKAAFCLMQGNYCRVTPRMKKTSYLTVPFTIEFDTYCDENNSSQGSPRLSLYYTDKDGNNTSSDIAFDKGDLDGRGEIDTRGFPHGLEADLPEALRNNYPNNWHHCAIICKNNQLKCYIDQYRILVIPDLGCTPTAFGFEGIGDQDHPIVITNVRAAAGGDMNMIGKKFTETKIVTHGITFDIDKSDIKPQSMGTLNMIVGVLKANPNLKFEIDGHTDNTGDAVHNLTLSQQRAEAVKAQLVKMGIDGLRITTNGFGDSKPISDNRTPEGRANNRRVEFVRM
jgi:outer membrane protein OmpA-like peptidoglycan-associated protein